MDKEKFLKIIKKVRQIAKFNPDIKDIVEHTANIHLKEYGEYIVLESISFSWYGSVWVYQNSIVYIPEHGLRKVILEYKNWDELLEV